jgi:hypothetical protein
MHEMINWFRCGIFVTGKKRRKKQNKFDQKRVKTGGNFKLSLWLAEFEKMFFGKIAKKKKKN